MTFVPYQTTAATQGQNTEAILSAEQLFADLCRYNSKERFIPQFETLIKRQGAVELLNKAAQEDPKVAMRLVSILSGADPLEVRISAAEALKGVTDSNVLTELAISKAFYIFRNLKPIPENPSTAIHFLKSLEPRKDIRAELQRIASSNTHTREALKAISSVSHLSTSQSQLIDLILKSAPSRSSQLYASLYNPSDNSIATERDRISQIVKSGDTNTVFSDLTSRQSPDIKKVLLRQSLSIEHGKMLEVSAHLDNTRNKHYSSICRFKHAELKQQTTESVKRLKELRADPLVWRAVFKDACLGSINAAEVLIGFRDPDFLQCAKEHLNSRETKEGMSKSQLPRALRSYPDAELQKLLLNGFRCGDGKQQSNFAWGLDQNSSKQFPEIALKAICSLQIIAPFIAPLRDSILSDSNLRIRVENILESSSMRAAWLIASEIAPDRLSDKCAEFLRLLFSDANRPVNQILKIKYVMASLLGTEQTEKLLSSQHRTDRLALSQFDDSIT
jgi:hypothetical protein